VTGLDLGVFYMAKHGAYKFTGPTFSKKDFFWAFCPASLSRYTIEGYRQIAEIKRQEVKARVSAKHLC